MEITILADGVATAVPENSVSTPGPGRIALSADAVEKALGWELKPEGLCQGSVCVPVRDRNALLTASGDGEEQIDLAAFAELMGRPVVLDPAAGVAALGTAAASRAASMASLEAPDFELPDLAGERHTLSAHRGKKVLLIAYASW